MLDKAIRFFVGDKVCVPDFKAATALQKAGVKDIVTLEGTQFKQGMISGGQQNNIFKLSLGTSQLDGKIMQLAKAVGELE